MLKSNEEIVQANVEAVAAAPAAAPTPVPVLVTPVHVPDAHDVTALVEAAHEHIEKLVTTELAAIQNTLAVAWRAAEANLAKATAENSLLRQQNEALQAKCLAMERKLAVLEEVRASLQKL